MTAPTSMAGALSQAANISPPQGGVSNTTPSPRPPDLGTPTPASGTGPAGGPGATPTPPLNSLYTQNPGANTFGASDKGQATTAGAAPTAAASNANAAQVSPLADISSGNINPNDSTNAASQLDAITNANSPYMQLAQHQGMLSAASRGLENSSLASGAAEAAAVQAAAPLAEQNAGAATQGMLSNAAAEQAARLQNSQLGTQASEFNASQANANQQLNAQMQTQQTQFNASQQQQAAATNAAAQNAMTQQTMQLNEQINQQYLSGTQSQTLASIQGQYNELIQQNASASGMYTSMLNNIGAVMANKDIAPSRVADTISAMQALLGSGLSIIDAINGGTPGVTPGAGPAPGGTQRTIQPVGGAGPANLFANEPNTVTPNTGTPGTTSAGGGGGALQTAGGLLSAASSAHTLFPGLLGHAAAAPAAAAPAAAAPAGVAAGQQTAGLVDPAVSHGYASLNGVPGAAGEAAGAGSAALPFADAAGANAAADLSAAQMLPSTEAAFAGGGAAGGSTAGGGAAMGAGAGAATALGGIALPIALAALVHSDDPTAKYWSDMSSAIMSKPNPTTNDPTGTFAHDAAYGELLNKLAAGKPTPYTQQQLNSFGLTPDVVKRYQTTPLGPGFGGPGLPKVTQSY